MPNSDNKYLLDPNTAKIYRREYSSQDGWLWRALPNSEDGSSESVLSENDTAGFEPFFFPEAASANRWSKRDWGWQDTGQPEGNGMPNVEWEMIPEFIRTAAGNDANKLLKGFRSDGTDAVQGFEPGMSVRDWSQAIIDPEKGLVLPNAAFQQRDSSLFGIPTSTILSALGAVVGGPVLGGAIAGSMSGPASGGLSLGNVLKGAGAGYLGGEAAQALGFGSGGLPSGFGEGGEVLSGAPEWAPGTSFEGTLDSGWLGGGMGGGSFTPLTASTGVDEIINSVAGGGVLGTGGVSVPGVEQAGVDAILGGAALPAVAGPLAGLAGSGVDLANSAATQVPGFGSAVSAATGPQSAASSLAKLIKDSTGIDISPSTLGLLGTGANTLLGMLSAKDQASQLKGIADQARGDRLPALNAFNSALSNPNSWYESAPAMGAVDAVTRKLSMQGNPALNPGLMSQAAAYNLGGYNDFLRTTGNLGLSGQDSSIRAQSAAALSSGTPYAVLGSGIANLTNPATQGSSTDINALIAKALRGVEYPA